MLPYVKIFRDLRPTVDMLSITEAGRLFIAILHYADDMEYELTGQERLVFSMLKTQFDRDAASYDEYLEKQRVNGKKGGRPKNPVVPESDQKNPVVSDNESENPGVYQENPKNPVVFLKNPLKNPKTQKSQEKEKEKEEDEEEEDYPPNPPLMGFGEAEEIQEDHDEIFQKAKYVGFDNSDATRGELVDLYSVHGKEVLLKAMDECVGVTGNKNRYLRKVLEGWGKPKPDARGDPEYDMWDEIEPKLLW